MYTQFCLLVVQWNDDLSSLVLGAEGQMARFVAETMRPWVGKQYH